MKTSLVSALLIASAAPIAAFVPLLPRSATTTRRPQVVDVVPRTAPTLSRRGVTPTYLLQMSSPPTQDVKSEEAPSAVGSYSFEGGFNTTAAIAESKPEGELSETQKLMAKVKDAGTAGVISYALWELGFWFISIPFVLLSYYEVMGHWPDLSNVDDMTKLSAEAFAFVNFARFAVPLRIGLALSTTPWIEENIVERFLKKGDSEARNGEESS